VDDPVLVRGASASATWAAMPSARSARTALAAQAIGQRLALQELHDEVELARRVVPKSLTSTMCSLPIWLTDLASVMKRDTTSGLRDSSGWIAFSATLRPITGCSARNTTPMPPSPSFAVMR
jgi:hypothetical protein